VRVPVKRSMLLQSFKTGNDAFVAVDSTQGFIVPFQKKGAEIVAALCASHDLDAEWLLLRAAQQYTISVYDSQFKRLNDIGAIYEASENTGVHCLRPEFYDEKYGLRPEAGPLEELIA
jgi:CRISPR-associated endonuclease/helicase Cas3